MLFPLLQLRLPFEVPSFLQVPSSYNVWIWVAIAVTGSLVLAGRILNKTASLFDDCPSCTKPVRKGQNVCNHCLKPMSAELSKTVARSTSKF